MNTTFWILSILMCLLAIAILVWPLLRVKQQRSIAYKESNLVLYRDKLAELDQDLAEGRIDQSGYRNAREELDRELLADVPEDSTTTAHQNYSSSAKAQPAIAVFIAAFIPAVSLLVYLQLGTHEEIESFKQQAATPVAEQKQPSVADMIQILEDRLKTQGGDVTAWSMLARGYKHLKRYEESASAFEVALEQEQQPSAELLLEAAEAMALAKGQKFDERARELVLKAVELEPGNINALWFAGVAEFQFGEYWKSVDHLAMMVEIGPPAKELITSVTHYLKQSRMILAKQGEDVSPIDEVLQLVAERSQQTKPAVDADVRRITVHVDAAAEIEQRYGASTTVFVYAKAQQGPKMPLAIQRISLADLPATVGLDDSMAMVAGMNLSAFNNLEVMARISPSGQAVTQSGDAVGSLKLDEVQQNNEVTIKIDTVVP